jgi:hypothetical protein
MEETTAVVKGETLYALVVLILRVVLKPRTGKDWVLDKARDKSCRNISGLGRPAGW